MAVGNADAAWRAMLVFAPGGQPDRRIAGLSVAGRAAAEARAAGAGRIVLQLGTQLATETRDDLRRICGDVDTGEPEEGGPTITLRCGRFIATAEALDAFVGSGRRALQHCGEIIAERPDAAGGVLDAASAFDPTRPRLMARRVMAATGKPGDGLVSRWLNRPVSQTISGLLLHLPGLQPAHATVATLLLALAMFAALIAGGTRGLVLGAILYQAASILDGVDGEVARATFRTSAAGAVFDTAVDVATNLLFVIGFTINLGAGGDPFVLGLAGWGLGLFVLGLGTIAWRTSRAGGPFTLDLVKHHYRHHFTGRLMPRLMRFLTIVSSRDFYALLFMLLILAGLPMAVLYLFAAAATVWILFVLGSIRISAGSVLVSRGV